MIFLQVSPPHASQQEARMLKSRFFTFYFTHFQLLFSASAEVFIFISQGWAGIPVCLINSWFSSSYRGFYCNSSVPSRSNNEMKLLDLRPLSSTQRPFWGSVHLTRWVLTIAGGRWSTTVLIFRHFEKELMILKRWSGRNSVGLEKTSMPSSLKSLKAVSQNKTGTRSHFVFVRNKTEYYFSSIVK